MNTFKRKALFTAVVAGLGVAGNAEAVFLSPNGTGQALVFPYFTTQSSAGNNWNTYISVVNTTTYGKAVKVRILEGKTSAEVLDFNLFLSPNDVWAAAIVPVDTAATSGAKIVTTDKSCVRPGRADYTDLMHTTGEPFRNYAYSGAPDNLPGTAISRTREGYVEMLEMGTLSGATLAAITHNSAGVPANCGVVQAGTFTAVPAGQLNPPTGGLMGTGTLINVNAGRDAGYKADALDNWSVIAQYSDSGATTPNLASASPPVSLVIRSGDVDPATGAATLVTAYQSTWAGTATVSAGAQAVASVFMHNQVLNEYVLDTASASLTDWVMTQPLKNQFVNATVANPPYTNVLTASGACETVTFSYFNREEQGATASGADFSPVPPAGPANSLCWESTVLSIRNPGATTMPSDTTTSIVLGSTNLTNVNVTSGFQNGWAALQFTGANSQSPVGLASPASVRTTLGTNAPAATLAAAAVTFVGLPVTGFMIRTFSNGQLTCGTAACQGNYGSSFNHSYRTVILP